MATTVPSSRSPEDLVLGARSGSAAALTELYGRFAAVLFRLAYRLTGTREDAEDTVHDVFVGLPDALRHYQERGRLESWLKRITARVALMRLRRQRRRRQVILAEPPPASPSREDAITLQQAVDTLPEGLRSVLVLKEVEGYSHREIAELLGISPVTSRVRLARALRKLRKALGGWTP